MSTDKNQGYEDIKDAYKAGFDFANETNSYKIKSDKLVDVLTTIETAIWPDDLKPLDKFDMQRLAGATLDKYRG